MVLLIDLLFDLFPNHSPMYHRTNRLKVQDILRPRSDFYITHFINGQFLPFDLDMRFDNAEPGTDYHLSYVARGGAAEIEAASYAASVAFKSWKDLPWRQRKEYLLAIADEIDRRAEEINLLESVDTGQPIRYMQSAAAQGAAYFRQYAEKVVDASNGQSFPDTHHINYSIRQPIGPVGIITPWNTPFKVSAQRIAPALAAGCTIVHKPAEDTPISALILAEIAQAVGLPKGVWNVVFGTGEIAGKALTKNPLIKAISFVGESKTGKQILEQGASTLKRVHFELGGKNPVIVFPDADLERALDAVIYMKFTLNGERCTSSSRLLLHRSIYESFLEKIAERIRKLRLGDPLDPETEIGPMINKTHTEKVLEYARIGVTEGARLITGGKEFIDQEDKIHFVEPTLFADVDPKMRIAREEIFGPFLSVIPFETEKEAVQIANDVPFGLTAYLWTKDVSIAHRISQNLEAGMVWVNSQNVKHPSVPQGGMKESGIGREGGSHGLDFFMETKNISIALGEHPIPKLGINNS